MKYSISVASIHDSSDIMAFINEHWQEGHLLATSEQLFLFQHQNALDPDKLNVVVAKDADSNVKAVLGFVPSEYANTKSDIFGALWKVADDVKAPMLGLKLLKFLRGLHSGGYFTLGLNETSASIYRLMKLNVGQMDHFVLINQTLANYKIAQNAGNIDVSACSEKYRLASLSDEGRIEELISNSQCRPKKDMAYMRHRYINHPFYSYELLGIYDGDDVRAMLVVREQAHDDSACLRIIDYVGDEAYLTGATGPLTSLLIERGLEYADMLAWGMDKSRLCSNGFTLAGENLIIPDYFSPFMPSNIPLLIAYDADISAPVRLFKGDGDQDRPSRLAET
jgi:hypothetical protein